MSEVIKCDNCGAERDSNNYNPFYRLTLSDNSCIYRITDMPPDRDFCSFNCLHNYIQPFLDDELSAK